MPVNEVDEEGFLISNFILRLTPLEAGALNAALCQLKGLLPDHGLDFQVKVKGRKGTVSMLDRLIEKCEAGYIDYQKQLREEQEPKPPQGILK